MGFQDSSYITFGDIRKQKESKLINATVKHIISDINCYKLNVQRSHMLIVFNKNGAVSNVFYVKMYCSLHS